MKIDYDLMRKAMNGDLEAAKMYCGSYMLIRNTTTNELFRYKGDIAPEGYNEVLWDDGKVYDSDGFLMARYWSLPRI